MKKIALLLWLVNSTLNLYSQQITEPGIIYGEVSRAELEMKHYEKDSSTDAVLLYDYGQTSFELKSGMIYMHYVYHGRIKILKKSALDLGTISKQLFKDGKEREQLISEIKGFTYNLENGEIKKEMLTKESVYIEKPVGSSQQVKINMPGVKEGSVIEYTYAIDTPFSIKSSPDTWAFQGDHPVVWSIYEITIPSYFNYKMLMSGYLSLTANESKEISVSLNSYNTTAQLHRFVVKDAPAFRNEAYMTNAGDYLSKIDFELSSIVWPTILTRNFSLDYASLNRTMLSRDMLGEEVQRTVFLKNIAKEIKNRYIDSTDRLKAACEYIQKNVQWNKRYSLYSDNLKKVLESHQGDAGDINLLLIALLREMGFDANPVILSTRGHGKIHDQYALLKRFNYVVAHIERDGKDFLMDATDEFLTFGMLPAYCLNGRGWLIHATNGRFVNIVPAEKEIIYKKADLIIDDNDEIKGTLTKSYGGYGGLIAKRNFKEKGREKYLEDTKKGNPTWIIENADYLHTQEPEPPMEAHYKLALTDYITSTDKVLYLKPMLSEGQKENLLKAKERLYPIDFGYAVEETFIATYEFPKEYSVVEMPKNLSVSLPENGGKFTYIITLNGNKLTVTSRIQLRKPVYYTEEYASLQEFFDKIVAKHNEQVVLKKN
jgi:hypothetical protein